MRLIVNANWQPIKAEVQMGNSCQEKKEEKGGGNGTDEEVNAKFRVDQLN